MADFIGHPLRQVRQLAGQGPLHAARGRGRRRGEDLQRRLPLRRALSYVQDFGHITTNADTTNKVVFCAFWPEHVVSVPVDYDGKKMRVWQYEVLEEVAPEFGAGVPQGAIVDHQPH